MKNFVYALIRWLTRMTWRTDQLRPVCGLSKLACLLSLCVLLIFAVPSPAQIPSGYVQTTATVPTLAGGSFGAAWTNLSSSPQLGLLGCVSTFQNTVNGSIDSYGHFSTLLADTAQICPTPSTWTFTLSCPAASPGAFQIQVAITGGGGTEDISSQITAALPAGICSGGGGGTLPIMKGGTGATTATGAWANIFSGAGIASNCALLQNVSGTLTCTATTAAGAWTNIFSGAGIASNCALLQNVSGTLTCTATTAAGALANLGGAAIAGAAFTGPISAPQINSTIYSSQSGCAQNSNLSTGGGTDATACIQTALNKLAAAGGGTFVQDGPSLVSNVVSGSSLAPAILLGSNTKLVCINGGGFFLAPNSNILMVGNTITGNPAATFQNNISINGCTFNGNDANQSRYENNNSSTGGWVFGMWFGGVNGVNLTNVTMKNARTFSIVLSNAKNITMQNVTTSWDTYTTSQNHDGVHFWGTLSGFVNNNYTDINGGDDSIALNTDEGVFDYNNTPSQVGISRYPWSGGALNNILFDGVTWTNTAQGIRWYGLTTAGGVATVSNITIRNVNGALTFLGMQDSGITSAGPITIDGWNVTGAYNGIDVPASSQLSLTNFSSNLATLNVNGSPYLNNGQTIANTGPFTITTIGGGALQITDPLWQLSPVSALGLDQGGNLFVGFLQPSTVLRCCTGSSTTAFTVNSSGATLSQGILTAINGAFTGATGTQPFTVNSTTPVANLNIGGTAAGLSGTPPINATTGTFSGLVISANSVHLTAQGNSVGSAAFVSTGLVMPSIPANTTVVGRCVLSWSQSALITSTTFGLGMNNAPAAEGLSVNATVWNGTTMSFANTGGITATGAQAVTGAIVPAIASMAYPATFDFSLATGSSAVVVTLYTQSSSTSTSDYWQKGSLCYWIP